MSSTRVIVRGQIANSLIVVRHAQVRMHRLTVLVKLRSVLKTKVRHQINPFFEAEAGGFEVTTHTEAGTNSGLTNGEKVTDKCFTLVKSPNNMEMLRKY